MMPQQYCLRWKHHHSNVQSMFAQLLEKERFCDVTLYCSASFSVQLPESADIIHPSDIKGVSLRAHRVVLAACSELLGALLGAAETSEGGAGAGGEPVLVLDGAPPNHLRALLDYMYTGEMNVHHTELPALLKTAEDLKIKGLTDIRWNNKDEPPDCQSGAITATSTQTSKKGTEHKVYSRNTKPRPTETEAAGDATDIDIREFLNGGPPPLIKLSTKEKNNATSPTLKREHHSDNESTSPKRQRHVSGTEKTDDEERDQEWKHGKLDMSVSAVSGWRSTAPPAPLPAAPPSPGGEGSEEEWGDAPADIGSFLDTRLMVDGDNTDDDSSVGSGSGQGGGGGTGPVVARPEPYTLDSAAGDHLLAQLGHYKTLKPTIGPKSGPTDPRFTDVVKLNDYLRHGRRPQFWEEDYVRRVMEAVRLKELEMKQAAEILGVSYGTLYGRYRDVYGCINRPYRTARELASMKGPTEILERLARGDIATDVAAQVLGVSARDLAAHFADVVPNSAAAAAVADPEFEPIPIEVDPQLKSLLPAPAPAPAPRPPRKPAPERLTKRVHINSVLDDEDRPGSSGKWPSIRIANVESLRGASSTSNSPEGGATSPSTPPSPSPSGQPSPSALMRARPDLTIVAARRPDPSHKHKHHDKENGT